MKIPKWKRTAIRKIARSLKDSGWYAWTASDGVFTSGYKY